VALTIPADKQSVPLKRQLLVMVTFVATVILWVSSPWHGIPTTVVSFLPICVLTATGILGPDDIRKLPWEVLLLIAGGLSLGVAIADTGLAAWMVDQLPLEQFSPLAVAFAFCYLMIVLSNLMSNTAAANMVLPLVLAASANANPRMIVPIALCASAAMCLPISTPPNALVFGTRRLKTVDMLAGGLLIGLVSPPVLVGWAWCVEKFSL
jgi:sodium-dependent dicarboxylate transporter 2/3/5